MKVSGLNSFSNISFSSGVDKTTEVSSQMPISVQPQNDTVEISKKNTDLTKAQKQEIIHNAKKTAAGWSILGEGISTLYYCLRSDKTVAEKYNLDVEKDTKFIKDIKKEQVIATLPAVFVPFLGGIVSYLYFNNQKPESITV